MGPTTVTSHRVRPHAPPVPASGREAGFRSHRGEGSRQLRGSEVIAPDCVRRATRGARPQGFRSRSAFVNAGGIAALRAWPAAGAASAELAPWRRFRVSTEAVSVLFGQTQGSTPSSGGPAVAA